MDTKLSVRALLGSLGLLATAASTPACGVANNFPPEDVADVQAVDVANEIMGFTDVTDVTADAGVDATDAPATDVPDGAATE